MEIKMEYVLEEYKAALANSIQESMILKIQVQMLQKELAELKVEKSGETV